MRRSSSAGGQLVLADNASRSSPATYLPDATACAVKNKTMKGCGLLVWNRLSFRESASPKEGERKQAQMHLKVR